MSAESSYERETKQASPRLELCRIIDASAQEAVYRIFDPKNVAKDGWKHIGWTELAGMLEEEAREMREEAMLGDREAAMREAGDVLAVVAMILDKEEEQT